MQNDSKAIDGIRPEDLEFEFVCHYNDGTELLQEYGTENEKNFGHIDQSKLETFELVSALRNIKLNIKTGEFDIDGFKCQFKLRDIPQEDIKRELVYFRRIRNDFTPEGPVTTVRYGLGWRATIDGQSHIRLILIERDGSYTFMMNK